MAALFVAALSVLTDVGDVRTERMATGLGAAAARAWSGEASAAYRSEAYEPAIALLRMASRFADHDAVVRYRLGLALRRAGHETEAIEAFRHAHELDPELEAATRVLNNDAP
jgi:Flp pilus assembly protein TadD